MKSPSKNETNKFNELYWWLNHFFPLPIQINFPIFQNYDELYLVTNARGLNLTQPVSTSGRKLVIVDSGGFLPEFATTFNLIDRMKVKNLLEKLSVDPTERNKLYVPLSIADYFDWHQHDQISGFDILLIPDGRGETTETIELNGKRRKNCWLCRVILALPIILGQISIFFLPLLIFGLQSLLIVGTTLLVTGIIIAISWNTLRFPGWIKGLIIGILGLGIFWMAKQSGIMINNGYIFAFGLSSIWLGLIFQGIAPY